MTSLLAVSLSLLAASPEVRVRLHESPKPFELKGSVSCGGQKVWNPVVRKAGKMMMVGSAKLEPGTVCSGHGTFTFTDVRWRGQAHVSRKGAKLRLVAAIDIESYVAGVVNAEVLPGWPEESLKAMAVAARTYSHHRMAARRHLDWDVTADVTSQVFRGGDSRRPVLRAVSATRGQILHYANRPAATYYHACSAGRTATAKEVWGQGQPYLKSVVSPDLACNRINWDSRIASHDAGKRLGLGQLLRIQIIGYTGSGRVKRVRVWGRSGKKDFTVQALRKDLGWDVVRSADFSAKVQGNVLVLKGHGSGHGVGMSQWGARGMALKGKNYREILRHYYSGTVFKE